MNKQRLWKNKSKYRIERKMKNFPRRLAEETKKTGMLHDTMRDGGGDYYEHIETRRKKSHK